jgi:hypothetical protein
MHEFARSSINKREKVQLLRYYYSELSLTVEKIKLSLFGIYHTQSRRFSFQFLLFNLNLPSAACQSNHLGFNTFCDIVARIVIFSQNFVR